MTSPHYQLDTNVFVDFLRGKYPNVATRLAESHRRLRVSVVVIGELRVAAERTRDGKAFTEVESALEYIERVDVTETISARYAKLRAELELAGQKLDANDLWIAASALAEGAILVSADEAFLRVPNLKVENWR